MPCGGFAGLHSKTIGIHVAEVDHCIAVVKLVGFEEVSVGFIVAFFN